jgi:hypothetical protein
MNKQGNLSAFVWDMTIMRAYEAVPIISGTGAIYTAFIVATVHYSTSISLESVYKILQLGGCADS